MKSKDKLKTRHKKKKKKGEEINLVCMRTSLAIGGGEGGFSTQFWLGPINTQTFVMMHLTFSFLFSIMVRSNKYTNTCDDAINYMFIFSVLHNLAQSFNSTLDKDIQ
jgi:hypothetical protein